MFKETGGVQTERDTSASGLCYHDVSLLGESTETAKKNAGLLDDSKQIGLETNVEESSVSLCLTTRMQDIMST
jgi:hypothetical protein